MQWYREGKVLDPIQDEHTLFLSFGMSKLIKIVVDVILQFFLPFSLIVITTIAT